MKITTGTPAIKKKPRDCHIEVYDHRTYNRLQFKFLTLKVINVKFLKLNTNKLTFRPLIYISFKYFTMDAIIKQK